MAKRVFVKPTKPGLQVRISATSPEILPAGGREMVWSPWLAERLREGDVCIVHTVAEKTPKRPSRAEPAEG